MNITTQTTYDMASDRPIYYCAVVDAISPDDIARIVGATNANEFEGAAPGTLCVSDISCSRLADGRIRKLTKLLARESGWDLYVIVKSTGEVISRQSFPRVTLIAEELGELVVPEVLGTG